MKTTKYIPLFLSSLILISCGEAKDLTTITSNPTNNSTQTNSTPSIEKPKFNAPTTITSLFNYINTEANSLELKDGASFSRSQSSYEVGVYSIIESNLEEQGKSYSNDALVIDGNKKTTTTYDYLNDPVIKNESYKKLNQIDGEYLYEIVDYKDGKEKDSATKTEIDGVNEKESYSKTGLGITSNLYSFYQENLSKQIVQGADEINPEKSKGITFYAINKSWTSTLSSGKYSYSFELGIDFDDLGRLKDYSLIYTEYQNKMDDEGNYTEDLVKVYEIRDEVEITFAEKELFDSSIIDHKDYFLTDYSLKLFSWNGYDIDRNEEDASSFPINKYVEIKCINPTPEKALDTELTIISSSDNSVISIDSYGIVKSKNIGKTILTIQSKSGIQKQLEVTVVIPSISKIEINSYNPFYFTDTDYNIHLNIDPDNTPYEIEVTSDKPEQVTITPEDDYWYKLNFKEKGTYNITAKSKSNPSVSCTKEFEVQGPKKTDEEIKASVVGTWKADLMDANGINTIKDAVTVIFNEDKTGTVTFNSDKTGYTFELNKPYKFTYDFTTSSYNDRPIKVTMSSIILDHGTVTWTYDKNYAEFYQTGEDSLITFSSTNNNEYGAEVQLKAKRQ